MQTSRSDLWRLIFFERNLVNIFTKLKNTLILMKTQNMCLFLSVKVNARLL